MEMDKIESTKVAASDGTNPTKKQKLEKAGRNCNFSMCDCTEASCTLKFARESRNFDKWDQFMSKCDPEYKFRKCIALCTCHMDIVDPWPRIDRTMVRMCDEIKKQKEKNNLIKTKLKRFLDDDQIKRVLSDPNVNHKGHWSPETLCKAVKMLEILGHKGYSHMESLNYPLPTTRTVRQFKASLRQGVDGEIVQTVQSMINENDDTNGNCGSEVVSNDNVTTTVLVPVGSGDELLATALLSFSQQN